MYFEIVVILVVLLLGDQVTQTGGATDTKKIQAQVDSLKADLAKLQRDATLTKAKYQTAGNEKIEKVRAKIAKLSTSETAKIDKLNAEIAKIQQKYQEAGEKHANAYNEKIDKVSGELSDLQDKLNEATEIQEQNDLELLGGIKTDISDPYQHMRLWKIVDWFRSFWFTR